MLPSSLTHQHILAVVNTLMLEKNEITILDAGCGDGKLIEFIYKSLSRSRPDLKVSIYGFDVYDHGVQADGFVESSIRRLEETISGVSWRDKIHAVKIDESWPFDDGFFDIVMSNQVLEHVHNKKKFFSSTQRALKENGYFIALNPLRHCIHEGHIYLPWAHRLGSHSSLWRYISLCSLLRLGKFPSHNKKTQISREDFAERHADYIWFWTSYSSEKETLKLAQEQGLRASFSFSLEFYALKLRQLFRLKYLSSYKYKQSNILILL